MKTLIAQIFSNVLITTAIISSVVAVVWTVYKWGMKRKAIDDLIYLEFEIRNGLPDPITRKNIQSRLMDYLSREEYQGDKLKYVKQLFDDRYPQEKKAV